MKFFTLLLTSLTICTAAQAGNETLKPATMVPQLPLSLQKYQLSKSSPTRPAMVGAAAQSLDGFHYEGKSIWAGYYEAEGGWSCFLSNDEINMSMNIFLVNSAAPGQFAGTYTIDDILGAPYESSFWDFASGNFYSYTDFNLVATGDDPNEACELTGDAVLDNGDHITFHYLKNPPLQPTETITVSAALNQLEFSAEAYDYNSHISATSADQKLLFDIVYSGTTGAGFACDKALTTITDLESGAVTTIDHGKVDVDINNDCSASVHALLVTPDAIGYDVTVEGVLQAIGSVDFVAHNMTVLPVADIMYFLYAENDEYFVQATINGNELPEGDYTDNISFSVSKKLTGGFAFSFVMKEATVSLDETDQYVLDACFLGDDLMEYTIHMDLQAPDITEQRSFVSTTGVLADLTYDLGVLQIMAYDDATGNDYVSFVLDAYELESGHYTTLSSTYKNYCNVVLDVYGTQEVLPIYYCSLDIDTDGRTFSLTGTCQAGTIFYDVNITGALQGAGPSPYDYDEDIDLTFSAEQCAVQIDTDMNYAYIMAEDGVMTFATLVYMDGEELEAGVYEINDTLEPGTAQAGQVDASAGRVFPTYCAYMNEDGDLLVPLWLGVSGTITISYDAAGQLSVVADAYNTYNRSIHVVINDPTTGIEQMNQAKASDGKMLKDGSVIVRHDGKQYNAYGMQLK